MALQHPRHLSYAAGIAAEMLPDSGAYLEGIRERTGSSGTEGMQMDCKGPGISEKSFTGTDYACPETTGNRIYQQPA